MSMSCGACVRAMENPETSYLVQGCRSCDVRMTSNQPRDVRETILTDMRMREGDERAEQFLRDVVSEFNRRQAWKRAFKGTRA